MGCLAARVQEELSRVVGSRQVQLEDRKVLHFTNAVVHETQRMANISPTSLPHRTCRDVTFQGFFIPKVSVGPSGRTGPVRSSPVLLQKIPGFAWWIRFYLFFADE